MSTKSTCALTFAAFAACGAIAFSSTALAADFGGSGPSEFDAQTVSTVPPWRPYVRGDVGIAQFGGLSVSQDEVAANNGQFISKSLADTTYVSAGLGVQFSERYRIELTGEYRSSAHFSALDNLSVELADPSATLQANTTYTGNLTSYVGMMNLYWDLFSRSGITPYIGAGIGVAHNRLSGIVTSSTSTLTDLTTDAQATALTHGWSQDRSKTTMAWALMAGVSFDLSSNSKLDRNHPVSAAGVAVFRRRC